MIFFSRDGKAFTGAGYREVVQAMANDSFTPGERDNLELFMAGTAMRVRQATGAEVRCDDPEAFLADLIQAGMLKPGPEA